MCAGCVAPAGQSSGGTSGGGGGGGGNPVCDSTANLDSNSDLPGLAQPYPDLAFSAPMVMLPDPADAARWLVAERDGRIWSIHAAAPAVKTCVGVVPGIETFGEGGLLGMAFHPDYPSAAALFVSYTLPGSVSGDPTSSLDSRISRFDIAGGVLGAEHVLLEVDQPEANHNGGGIVFGPDGYLYIALGDGGGAGDVHGTFGNGQDLTTLLGKLLRVDVDGGSPYGIPPDNPFVGMGGGIREEIYAFGLRNPWRFSFDRDTGDLWLGDVGQGGWEEVDMVASGDNLGWRIMEGAHCYNPASGCDSTGLTLPVTEYGHAAGNCSITGGYVYRGTLYPAWDGLYFFGDYCTGRIWSLPVGGGTPAEVIDSDLNIASFAEDHGGEIYVLGLNTGRIYHVVPPTAN